MLVAGRCLFAWPAAIFPVIIATVRSPSKFRRWQILKGSRGKGSSHKFPIPCSLTEWFESVNKLCKSPHHSVSVTGGEPLLNPFAVIALSAFRTPGVKIFLETNGTLPEALSSVVDAIDIISMDIKLPSEMKGKSCWQEHADFLQIAAKREVYVKIVLSGTSVDDEILQAVDLVATISRDIPLVLQPVTPINGVYAVSSENILRWQTLAMKQLSMVRVIPQTHKLLGML